MSRVSLTIVAIISLSLTLQESNQTINGDFNGDGVFETATIYEDHPGQNGNGEDIAYIPASRSLIFSNKQLPKIQIENSNAVYNIGDINRRIGDEVLISGRHNEDLFEFNYSVYTYDTTQKWWLKVLDANIPSSLHHPDPSEWVYLKHDTLFYWSSKLVIYDLQKSDVRPFDTLCWQLK